MFFIRIGNLRLEPGTDIINKVKVIISSDSTTNVQIVTLPPPSGDPIPLEEVTDEMIREWISPYIDRDSIKQNMLIAQQAKANTAVRVGDNFVRRETIEAWEPDKNYQAGNHVYHTWTIPDPEDPEATIEKTEFYRVVQDHTSQTDWAPNLTAALFTPIVFFEGEYPGWQQPQGAHDAYPKDFIVNHNGQLWVSDIDANVWEPPEQWTEFNEGEPEEPGEPEAWVQPTGEHDAYNQGDIVTHNDQVWISDIDANVWEPPEQWSLYEE